jgi:hypothetical protein
MNDTNGKLSFTSSAPVVWKFQLNPKSVTTLELPVGAIILSSAIQVYPTGPIIAMWVQTSPAVDETETRHFNLYLTGAPLPFGPEKMRFVNTIVAPDYATVWHLFETLNPIEAD